MHENVFNLSFRDNVSTVGFGKLAKNATRRTVPGDRNNELFLIINIIFHPICNIFYVLKVLTFIGFRI